MKKLLFAASALAAISLLAPSFSYAVNPFGDDFVNRIGIYTTATGSATYIDPAVINTEYSVYMLLINPRKPNGTPVTLIDGFECTVTVDGPTATGWFQLEALTLPGGSQVVDLGSHSDSGNQTYFAGAGVPAPVTDGICVLVQWSYMLRTTPNEFNFFVSPYPIPSIADRMAFQDNTGSEIIACTPSNTAEDIAAHVFCFNCLPDEPIATETTSFGNVKALFR